MDPSWAPREAVLSTAFTGEPAAAAACRPTSGKRSVDSTSRGGVLSRRHGPPRRINAEEYPVPPAATQGHSGEAPRRDRVSQTGE